ncbi:MAG: hypothetical protein QOI95_2174 [Acidimicrobiaceae bacterium]|jgi:hypothetical protein
MTELRQALYALVEHPPVAPDIEVVAARGTRLIRRRRIVRGATALTLVVIASAAGFGVAQHNSDPGVFVATQGAGPAVSYTDPAGDAIRLGSPTSRPEFDIVQVGWAPASDTDQPRGGYSASMTVAGSARDDGYYVSYGDFPADVAGEQCQIYHFLTPRTDAFANVFCGREDAGTRRLIGRMQGSAVITTATPDGGTLLEATFDDSTLPQQLQTAGRLLSNLSAFTCDENTDFPVCGTFEGNSDFVASAVSYRV